MTLLVVRHADAGHRSRYQGDDRERPLSAGGRAQAAALVGPLSGYQPTAILSSPFVRCVETVQPLADALGLAVETTDALAEGHGADALELMGRRLGGTEVFCIHGDVATAIVDGLTGGTRARDRRLQKGEVWVLEPNGSEFEIVDHIRRPAGPGGPSRRDPPPVR